MSGKLFNMVKINKPRRNVFDLSHEKKLSLNMGDLVPIIVMDVVPGDKFQVSSEMLLRFAPMIAPLMHRINAYIHFFYVPNRLVWDNWQYFITGGEDGSFSPSFPRCEISSATKAYYYKGTLSDYMGVPNTNPSAAVSSSRFVSALPFRAYQLIYNEYYRDQNLQSVVGLKKTDTVTTTELASITTMRKRNWEKDYFTSALPWVQKGADVVLPGSPDYADTTQLWDTVTNTAASSGAVMTDAGGKIVDPGDGNAVRVENLDGYDITINDLRRATKLQEWLEKNARAGSRYIESILSHFGVRSSDARLQRPEYLGGGRTPVVVSEVLNTSDTATRAQGDMAGHGIGVGKSNTFRKYFEEHGYIIGIMSVMPRTAYQQGTAKHLLKFDKFDYYWPEFAHLGEQEIKCGELYDDYLVTSTPQAVFGYTPRYSEYKFGLDSVHGDFKDNLSFWHEGRIFSAQPALNSAFISSDPSHRIFAVTTPTIHKVYCQIYNQVRAIRPMPVFGSPLL